MRSYFGDLGEEDEFVDRDPFMRRRPSSPSVTQGDKAESKQRRKDARHQDTLRRQAEATCHARPSDHAQRTEMLVDGQGMKARRHDVSGESPSADEDIVTEPWGNNFSTIDYAEPDKDE